MAQHKTQKKKICICRDHLLYLNYSYSPCDFFLPATEFNKKTEPVVNI